MEKLIITAALTGNVPTREMNPHTPITPDEIARNARECALAGASLFHLHARGADEKPTLDPDVYREISEKVRATAPCPIIQLSTGARAGRDWEDRAAPVRLKPEMASFTTGSNNMPGIVYENSPKFIEFLAGVFRETGVKPEIEAFEPGMIANALFLVKKGYLKPPLHFNFVLGVPGAMPATVKNLLFMSESIPPDSSWTVSTIGKNALPLSAAAIALGGHVRVGLEDNPLYPDRTPATNREWVEKITRIAEVVGRPVASPDEARGLLGLERR